MHTCEFCGVVSREITCQTCRKYFKNGGIIHPLPEKGVIAKDERGYVICHICGKAYYKLSEHIHRKHHLSDIEYKEIFGICNSTVLACADYIEVMRQHTKENGTSKYLVETFRFKKGINSRKGQERKLQEKIRIAEHNRRVAEHNKELLKTIEGHCFNDAWKKNFVQFREKK